MIEFITVFSSPFFLDYFSRYTRNSVKKIKYSVRFVSMVLVRNRGCGFEKSGCHAYDRYATPAIFYSSYAISSYNPLSLFHPLVAYRRSRSTSTTSILSIEQPSTNFIEKYRINSWETEEETILKP